MKIKPLRDIIVAVMIDDTDMVGALVIPKNKKQALLQHGRALVVAAGPIAKEQGIDAGMIVHCSEVWGDKIMVGDKAYKIGRSRDVNGICEGEAISDQGKYLD